MRKLISALLCICILLCCVMASAETVRYVKSTNSAPVNVRTGATRSSDVVSQLVTGTKVTSLGTEGDWTHIRFGGKEGYIMTVFLTSGDPYDPGTGKNGQMETEKPVYIVASNRRAVNLRAGTGQGSSVIAQIPSGTSAILISTGSNWSKVRVNGKTGFVHNDYLSQEKPETVKKTGANTENDPQDPLAPVGTAFVHSLNSAPVNLRSAPRRASASVTKLVTGTKVSILSREGSWSQVSVAGKTGYIMNLYLTSEAPGTYTPANSYTAYVCSDNGGAVRVRYGAGTGYHPITSLTPGTKLMVLTTVNGWARIRCGDVEGYINEKYLTVKP